MSILEMCNERSISAYENELERQKNLNNKADLLFKWLTLLIAVFNFIISILTRLKGEAGKYGNQAGIYFGMMVFFMLAFVTLLIINFPAKRKLPSLGSEQLKKIQSEYGSNSIDDNFVCKKILYKEILEHDVITKELRSHNQKVAIAIMGAEIFMALGLIFATIILGCSIWKG